MSGTWINFRDLRKSLSFEAVLKHYGIELKQARGNRHQGFCPLPTHQGKKKSPSFSAKLDYGVWQCFGCRASGNVLDFAVRMEGLDPQKPKDLRAVALKLVDIFGQPKAPTKPPTYARTPPARVAPPKEPPILINPPMDFELKDLDVEHPYLKDRGLTAATIKHFGLGYCNRGLMKGRVAIPLHDADGKRIGYAGRLVDDTAVDAENPKYLLPSRREREGKVFEFKKSLFLYHGSQVKGPVEDLIVVEGFPATWWLWQWDYKSAVALMGAACSPEQAKLIICSVIEDGTVWVLSDSDKAGEACAASVLTQVAAPHRRCRWAKLSQGQPTDCTPGDLAKLLWPV